MNTSRTVSLPITKTAVKILAVETHTLSLHLLVSWDSFSMDFQTLCPLLPEEKRRSKDIPIHVGLVSSRGPVRTSQPNHLTNHKAPAIPTSVALT